MSADFEEMQAGVDQHDAELERRFQHEEACALRQKALALIEAHPESYRVDFADRLLAMGPDDLARYLDLRTEFDRKALASERYGTYRDWIIDAECAEYEASGGLFREGVAAHRARFPWCWNHAIPEPNDARPGQDPRIVLGEVDHPTVERDEPRWPAA